MRQYRALFTVYRADMPAWAYPAKIEAFQATDAVNLPAFPPQLDMDVRAAITYRVSTISRIRIVIA
jgi:hypothetical protein